GLEVAHLADEHHVGILTKNVPERYFEADGVASDFALVDDAEFVAVQKLDRVFDGDDVLPRLGVDLVDDRGERRRLARPGRPGDKNEASRLRRQLRDDGREAKLLERADLEGNRPKGTGHRAPLHEEVRAKPGDVLDTEREVKLVVLLEKDLLLFGQDR